jgi:general secretion pathway protein F
VKTFEYAATDAQGAVLRGRAWAASEVELDRELEGRGLTLTAAKAISGDATSRRLKLSRYDLLALTTQLATVTAAGVSLVDGLESIGERLESERARLLVGELVAALRSGESLSGAMERFPATFPEVYRSSVRAGEASGSLDTVLLRLAKYLEWSRGMRATTVQAMIYPGLLITALFGLVLVLLGFLLPRVLKLFPGGKESLPTETRIVLGASEFLRENALALGAGAVALAAAVTWLARQPYGKRFLHGWMLAIPRFGRVVQQLATSRFASTASILQSAGCDVFTVLNIAGSTCGNASMAACFARSTESVRKGATITQALERERYIDPLLTQMVNIGERTGQLDDCLTRLVAYYDEEVPRTVKRFLAFLEPAMLLAAGAVVAFILMAALMPIFKLYENIG